MANQHVTGVKRPLQGDNLVNTDCSKKQRKGYNLSEIPEDDLERLKCSKCDGYLSCSPVKSKDEDDNVCGRCSTTMTNNRGYTRNIVYETLANKRVFPCNNKIRGCNEKILFNDIQHEKYCKLRAYRCPHRECFQRNITKDEMIKHYNNKHPDLIFEYSANLMVPVTLNDEFSAVIKAYDNLFVACIKTFPKKCILWLSVRYVGSTDFLLNYHYNIEIFNSFCSNSSFKQDRKLLLPYRNDFLERDTAESINLRSIFRKYVASIRIIISIGRNFEENLKLPVEKPILPETRLKLIADNILSTPSTSKMNDVNKIAMLRNKNGKEPQSLPSTSKIQDSDKSSNHLSQMLEETTSRICINKECSYFGNRQTLQKHEKYFCPYNRKCFACDGNTFSQLKTHLQEMHSNHVFESPVINMKPKVNNWWMIMKTTDKTMYYCKITEKQNQLYLQITSNQDTKRLEKFIVQVDKYYMYPDRVNNSNSLVDWEIRLDECKKLDRNKTNYFKFIGIKKE